MFIIKMTKVIYPLALETYVLAFEIGSLPEDQRSISKTVAPVFAQFSQCKYGKIGSVFPFLDVADTLDLKIIALRLKEWARETKSLDCWTSHAHAHSSQTEWFGPVSPQLEKTIYM